MRYLSHESEGPATLKNGQVLGADSPLEFDENGHAGPMEDDVAETLAAMHTHVTLGDRARGGDEGTGGEFDADEFVDRTPMEDVVADIQSGDYDDHLDAIGDAAERQGVRDAIEARQD